MDDKDLNAATAFDSLFTTGDIQIIKILLPALPFSLQKGLAVYIKLQELKVILSSFDEKAKNSYLSDNHKFDLLKMQDELRPFCDKSSEEQLNTIINLIKNFESMKEMLDTMRMMQELFPQEGVNFSPFGDQSANGFDFSELLQFFQKE